MYNANDYYARCDELVGKSVMTYYNNRVYTISDFKHDLSVKNTFHHQHMGKDISYQKYMKEQYGLKVTYHD